MSNVVEISRAPEVRGDTPDLMPQAIAAEEEILGALMWDTNAYHRIESELKPEHFYISAHGRIYKVAQQLVAAELPVDLLTMTGSSQDASAMSAQPSLWQLALQSK